jgi:hypothetical protein
LGSCGVWSTEHLGVPVSGGAFAVKLGENTNLTDSVLANDQLWVAIAVRSSVPAGGTYTLLMGKQRLLAVPWAVRPAAAQNFKVRGTLTVNGQTTTAALSSTSINVPGPNVTIGGNGISGNNTGNGHVVGGVLFNTSSTLTSFIGNKVHSNTGDELGFGDVPNGGSTQWVINPPSATCDATANSLYCYGSGNVGLHVLSGTASVNAQHVHWTDTPPTSGIDFSGAATVTNPCTAIATCP